MKTETKNGWVIPPNQMTAHYFQDGLALCGAIRYQPRQPAPDGGYRKEYCCEHCLELREAYLRDARQLPLFPAD